MYIQGMAQQTQVFMLSTGFGFLLGAVYDVIRFIRKIISPGSTATVIQDIIFFIICTFSVFAFLLCVDDGRFRLYPYLGMAAGFFIWYFTLGIPVKLAFDSSSGFIRRFSGAIFRKIRNFFRKTIKIFQKNKNKTAKPLEKSINNSV